MLKTLGTNGNKNSFIINHFIALSIEIKPKLTGSQMIRLNTSRQEKLAGIRDAYKAREIHTGVSRVNNHTRI